VFKLIFDKNLQSSTTINGAVLTQGELWQIYKARSSSSEWSANAPKKKYRSWTTRFWQSKAFWDEVQEHLTMPAGPDEWYRQPRDVEWRRRNARDGHGYDNKLVARIRLVPWASGARFLPQLAAKSLPRNARDGHVSERRAKRPLHKAIKARSASLSGLRFWPMS
jgi:hypothetical protein